ncbi:collagenase-like [Thrips palmi]|uniref:Collagenase-like n=1 Tax=Thrips palmi TaxID=161013 RepID=A0A6P8Y4V2_THRPL|nr:collagenase-like [Thrips palmi]
MWKLLTVLALVAATAVQAAYEDVQPKLHASQAKSAPHDAPLRIVNGDEATPGQFPHQVGIEIDLVDGRKAFCGGSILTEHIIITAAHCAEHGTQFLIWAGAHEIDQDGTPYITKKKLVHEKFGSDGAVANDIALLYVREEIKFNDRVQPIRLPSAEQAQDSFWKAQVTMSGWGLTHTRDEKKSPVLRFVTSRVVSNLYCRARFFFRYVQKTNICVSGWWAKGTCQGDSGGPMVVYEADGKPTLIGLTSFGVGLGCAASWPNVFTRVTSYLDWIESSIEHLSLAR